MLEKLTLQPSNYYRALESDKDKREFMQMMHRNIGLGQSIKEKKEY
jgi:hypothetical protein